MSPSSFTVFTFHLLWLDLTLHRKCSWHNYQLPLCCRSKLFCSLLLTLGCSSQHSPRLPWTYKLFIFPVTSLATSSQPPLLTPSPLNVGVLWILYLYSVHPHCKIISPIPIAFCIIYMLIESPEISNPLPHRIRVGLCGQEKMFHLRLGHSVFCLSLFFGSLTVGKASYHVLRTFKQAMEWCGWKAKVSCQ